MSNFTVKGVSLGSFFWVEKLTYTSKHCLNSTFTLFFYAKYLIPPYLLRLQKENAKKRRKEGRKKERKKKFILIDGWVRGWEPQLV